MKTKNKKIIMLIITEACNLNCIYCFEHSKSARFMSFSTAKNILDQELSDGMDSYEVHLFGGEPLMNFDLIKKIDEYIFELCKRTDVRIFIVTNGTLMRSEQQAWFSDAKRRLRTVCGLSIDGNTKAHNASRCGSFNLIPVDFFAKNWEGQACRMTIHSSNIEYFSDGVKYLASKGFTSIQSAFAQSATPWVTPNLIRVFNRELEKLVEYFIQNPEKTLPDLLDVDFSLLARPLASKNRDHQYCGAGKSLFAYDTEGNKFPCQSFAHVTVGELSSQYAEIDIARISYRADPFCRDCVFLPVCPTCLGMNLADRGDATIRDHSLCDLHKARFLASAKLKFHRYIEKKSEAPLTLEEFTILSGIARVQQSVGASITLPDCINFESSDSSENTL